MKGSFVLAANFGVRTGFEFLLSLACCGSCCVGVPGLGISCDLLYKVEDLGPFRGLQRFGFGSLSGFRPRVRQEARELGLPESPIPLN